MNLEWIREAFLLPGHITEYQMLTNGGIHETCQIRLSTGKQYIFQHMNLHVFPHPETVMQNISHVTAYLSKFSDMQTLQFYQTAQKEYFFHGWRIMDYIPGYSLPTMTDLNQIHQAGKAFGQFQSRVSQIDSRCLLPVIPAFHDTEAYFRKLSALGDSSEETQVLMHWQKQACSVMNTVPALPHIITHNDMKCSNLLFDRQTHQPIAVIDLDTVMPGLAVYDFGDAVRSIAVNADRSGIDLEKFKAFVSGWLLEMQYSSEETSLLIPAVFAVTVELAVRYLTDYLQGNLYFKVSFPEQSRIKAGKLIHLAQDILQQETEMQKFIIHESEVIS